jgi:hypothetical protein
MQRLTAVSPNEHPQEKSITTTHEADPKETAHVEHIKDMLASGKSGLLTEGNLHEMEAWTGEVDPKICTVEGLTGHQTWFTLAGIIRKRRPATGTATGASTGA